MLSIQAYSPEYSHAVAELFTAAIHAISEQQYSAEQKLAWAPLPIDYELWRQRLRPERCYLALLNQQLAGFIELEGDYIDCFYVAPRYQGQQVGLQLYRHIEAVARQRQLPSLRVDASLAAKAFFLKQGFELVSRNQVERNGQVLSNFTLQKHLF
ncbi:GNAT family N-acetyltransferase [Agarivorans sp.]|uniref:GNAT family N-acetyltransferase n=1 Tax=Agarivorans sp. TaxID=1872412 RepID=UPI003CFF1646